MCERINLREIKTPKLRNEANKLLVFNNTGHGVDLRPSANRRRRAVRTIPPERGDDSAGGLIAVRHQPNCFAVDDVMGRQRFSPIPVLAYPVGD